MQDGKTGRASNTNIARNSFLQVGKDWTPKGSDELYAEAPLNGMPIPLSAISGK